MDNNTTNTNTIDEINTIEQIYILRELIVHNMRYGLHIYNIAKSLVPQYDYNVYNYMDPIFANTIEQTMCVMHIPLNDGEIALKKIDEFCADYSNSYKYFMSIGLDNIPLLNYIKITLGFKDTLEKIDQINKNINLLSTNLHTRISYYSNQKQIEEINNTLSVINNELANKNL
jgi:hypothetical protein